MCDVEPMCAYCVKLNDGGLYHSVEPYCLFSWEDRYQRSSRTGWEYYRDAWILFRECIIRTLTMCLVETS